MRLSHRTATVLLAVALIGGAPAASAVAAPVLSAQQSKVVTPSAWAKQQWGTFSTWTRSGVGDDVVTLPKTVKSAILEVQHDGTSNFVVWGLSRSNDETDLLVNEIGAYKGTTAFGLEDKGTVRGLEITADGAWTVTAKPVSKAALLPRKGTGAGVFLLANHRTARFTHDGSSNFVITQHTGGRFGWHLVVNEIGAYKGTVRLDRGPSVVEVDADGHWTASPR